MSFLRDLSLTEFIIWMGVCLAGTVAFAYALHSAENLPRSESTRWVAGTLIAFVVMWRSATRLGGGLAYPLGAALFYSVIHDATTVALTYPVLALAYNYGSMSADSRRRTLNLMTVDLLENQLIEQHKLQLGPGFSAATLRPDDLCPVCRRKLVRNLEAVHGATVLGEKAADDLHLGTCPCWEPLRSTGATAAP